MYSSTALYYRALRRVQRRAARYRALAPLGPVRRHCPECDRALELLRDACRLANRLAA